MIIQRQRVCVYANSTCEMTLVDVGGLSVICSGVRRGEMCTKIEAPETFCFRQIFNFSKWASHSFPIPYNVLFLYLQFFCIPFVLQLCVFLFTFVYVSVALFQTSVLAHFNAFSAVASRVQAYYILINNQTTCSHAHMKHIALKCTMTIAFAIGGFITHEFSVLCPMWEGDDMFGFVCYHHASHIHVCSAALTPHSRKVHNSQ